MIISDLNYLESAEGSVEGGYYFGPSSKTIVVEKLFIFKKFDSDVDVDGNFAGAESDAQAYGDNTSTQALAFTFTNDYFSASSATAVSATD